MAKWKSERKTSNNFLIDVDLSCNADEFGICLMADWHWDNPKCDRKLLERHLAEAQNRNMAIVVIGDLFCAMQGKYDKRANKSDVRPEHQHGNYLDRLVDTAVDYCKPFADSIACIGYGNHETSIIKRCESDLLQRLCGGIGKDVAGGYTGYLYVRFRMQGKVRASYRIKYAHGWGGGGPVTKGAIQNNRRQVMYPNADAIVTGHVHEATTIEYVVESLNERTLKTELRSVEHIQCPTYKEEYGEGGQGWHVERGAPPKPLGCWAMFFSVFGSAGDHVLKTRTERWR